MQARSRLRLKRKGSATAPHQASQSRSKDAIAHTLNDCRVPPREPARLLRPACRGDSRSPSIPSLRGLIRARWPGTAAPDPLQRDHGRRRGALRSYADEQRLGWARLV